VGHDLEAAKGEVLRSIWIDTYMIIFGALLQIALPSKSLARNVGLCSALVPSCISEKFVCLFAFHAPGLSHSSRLQRPQDIEVFLVQIPFRRTGHFLNHLDHNHEETSFLFALTGVIIGLLIYVIWGRKIENPFKISARNSHGNREK
jgi:hypothetical protein